MNHLPLHRVSFILLADVYFNLQHLFIAYAASRDPKSLLSLLSAMSGLQTSDKNAGSESHMTIRERLDFIIVVIVFGVLVGGSVHIVFIALETLH